MSKISSKGPPSAPPANSTISPELKEYLKIESPLRRQAYFQQNRDKLLAELKIQKTEQDTAAEAARRRLDPSRR